MRFFNILNITLSLLPVAFCAPATFPFPFRFDHHHRQPTCLTDVESARLVAEWVKLWYGQVSRLNAIIAPNFEFFEGDDTNGKIVPVLTGPTKFRQFVLSEVDPKINDAITLTEYPLFQFHGCDRIAVRWEEIAQTTGLNVKKTGVTAGRKFKFQGTDLLRVNLRTRQIYEAVTSQDSLNYNRNIGYTLQIAKKA